MQRRGTIATATDYVHVPDGLPAIYALSAAQAHSWSRLDFYFGSPAVSLWDICPLGAPDAHARCSRYPSYVPPADPCPDARWRATKSCGRNGKSASHSTGARGSYCTTSSMMMEGSCVLYCTAHPLQRWLFPMQSLRCEPLLLACFIVPCIIPLSLSSTSKYSLLKRSRNVWQEPFHRRLAFDLGDVGIGQLTNSLELGCDCLGSIHYFDAVLNNSKGGTAAESLASSH